MMTKHAFLVLCATIIAGLSSRAIAFISMDIQLDAAGVFTNQDGQIHDVYRVTIANGDSLADVTSLTLNFGPLVLDNGVNQTFATNDDYPVFGFAPDSFFVIPPGTTQLAVDVIDDGTTLAASYTLQGADVLIPAGETATVAMLSVPAGAPHPIVSMGWGPFQQIGLAVIFDSTSIPPSSGPFEVPIYSWPEPASLALLTLGGFAVFRRSR